MYKFTHVPHLFSISQFYICCSFDLWS